MHLKSLTGKLGYPPEKKDKRWLLKDTPKCEFSNSTSCDISQYGYKIVSYLFLFSFFSCHYRNLTVYFLESLWKG